MRLPIVDSPRSAPLRGVLLVTAIALLAAVGCSSSTKPKTDAGSSTYTGAVAGATISGKLAVTIANSDPSTASGSFGATGTFVRTIPAGYAPVSLTGNFQSDFNRSFSIEGIGAPGDTTGFLCSLTGYGFSGSGSDTITAIPLGELVHTSLFKGTSGVIIVFGSFASTPPGTSGTFNFAILGTEVHGWAVATSGAYVPLDGHYVAGTGAITIDQGTPPLPFPGFVPPTPASATLLTTTAGSATTGGKYFAADGTTEIGTWTGTVQP